MTLVLNLCTVARIMGAIIEVLVPHINVIKEELSCVKNDLANIATIVSNLNETVSNLSGELEECKQQSAYELAGIRNTTSDLHTSLQLNTQQLYAKMDMLDLKMVSVNASLREELKSHLDYKQHAASELAGLQSTFDTLLTSQTQQLKEDLSILNDSMNRISENVEAHDSHVTNELMELDQNLQHNYRYRCGDTGGWRRVVYLNFTDPNTPCPSGWQLTSLSKRTCSGGVSFGCDSVIFPVSEGDYTRVCGRIIAYQDRYTHAFHRYHWGRATTIEDFYVYGVSLTHGSPRQHIWTFAAGLTEFGFTYHGSCPCDATINISIPLFMDGDYFCESGTTATGQYKFYPDDPLWDGDGCTSLYSGSTCCSLNNPPYFTKQLLSPTTDDIEARLCHLPRSSGDTPVEFIELYVQ